MHNINPAIDAVLDQAVSNGTVLGVAAMGATPDGVVYDGAFGKANVETGAPMRDDTVFWLLSMTKAFTATAAMQLIEQGRMHLDQPARRGRRTGSGGVPPGGRRPHASRPRPVAGDAKMGLRRKVAQPLPVCAQGSNARLSASETLALSAEWPNRVDA